MTTSEVGLFLDGLRCSGCVNRVERALRETAGVEDATVNYTTHRALVRYDTAALDEPGLVARVVELGYGARPYDPARLDRPESASARSALTRVLVAGFLAGNVMWIAIALYLGGPDGLEPELRRALRWLAIALSVPAVVWCALPFWQGAIAGLRRGELTLDVPIVAGVTISFVVSVLGTLAESPELFMDSAAMIVFLILLGRTLERGARARAAGAVERLAALSPALALRVVQGGTEQVAVDELRPGDIVRIAPGERVPVDARLLHGACELDESLLTGESAPVLREAGAQLTGGTTNLLAEVDAEVVASVAEGTLARLGELLERAQGSRPRIQRLADRVAAWFAPAVLAAAALAAVAWALAGAPALQVALTSAAVLIVACPCALGLATPAAVTAAVGRAAELGILVKSGEALERCAGTRGVILDKTGTLTEGRLAIEEVLTAPGFEPAMVLAEAAFTEGASTHPLAAAIREATGPCREERDEAVTRRVLPGRGVEAETSEGTLRVGSRTLLAEAGIPLDPTLDGEAKRLAERGLGLAFVAREQRVLGVIALSDPLRADAADAIAALRGLELEVALVSGDHALAASLAARRAGIEAVSAEVTPEAKVEEVRRRRSLGGVMVVGDGINDAAALAAADLGVAMASGSDVTLLAADAVIRAPRLMAVADLVGLSRATLARIRENLGFAVAYNVVAVPLAAFGVLQPLHAAIAMSLSSLVVTGNAIRLLGYGRRR